MNLQGADWEQVIIRKKAPSGKESKDEAAVNAVSGCGLEDLSLSLRLSTTPHTTNAAGHRLAGQGLRLTRSKSVSGCLLCPGVPLSLLDEWSRCLQVIGVFAVNAGSNKTVAGPIKAAHKLDNETEDFHRT